MGKWEMVRLGDVSTVITKGTTPTTLGYSFVDVGVNFIKIENITLNNRINHDNLSYISEECHKKLKRSQIEEGDILFSIAGAIGRCAIVDVSILPANTNQALAIIRLKDNSNIYKKFLLVFLQSESIINQYSKMKQGVAQLNISLTNVGDFYVPLPPLPVQQKIADILDCASALIEKRKAQIEKLDLLVKSQFIEMFGDPVTNPMKWKKSPMGQHLSLLTDFSANGSYEYLDSSVVMHDHPNYALMVRTTDLEKQNFSEDVKYISEEAYEILRKSKLFGGEIIMNKIGSAGKVYLMPILNYPASLGRNAFMFRYKDSIKPMFIYFLLTSKYGDREIQQHVRGAVTKTITKDAVRSIPIIVPPITLQTQFAAFVERVEAQKAKMKQGLELMELEYKSLMQKCFRGGNVGRDALQAR